MTPSSPADPILGAVVDGRYRVLTKVARGGMATVYTAHDDRLGRIVALKVMHPHLAADPEFAARFEREAHAAAGLANAHVVAVHDQGRDGEITYLVMEYVPGHTLRAELRDKGALTIEEAFDILEAVLSALSAAHTAGIVHRDVKPENVLLASDGRIKVADFGLARAIGTSTASATGSLLGTVAYIAPELVTRGSSDQRSDLYSVGVMLYEMLTGRQPYEGELPVQVAFAHVHHDIPAPSTIVHSLPRAVDDLVREAASRDPDLRPGTAAIMLERVRAVRASLPPSTLTERPLVGEDSDTQSIPRPTRQISPMVAAEAGAAAHPDDVLETPRELFAPLQPDGEETPAVLPGRDSAATSTSAGPTTPGSTSPGLASPSSHSPGSSSLGSASTGLASPGPTSPSSTSPGLASPSSHSPGSSSPGSASTATTGAGSAGQDQDPNQGERTAPGADEVAAALSSESSSPSPRRPFITAPPDAARDDSRLPPLGVPSRRLRRGRHRSGSAREESPARRPSRRAVLVTAPTIAVLLAGGGTGWYFLAGPGASSVVPSVKNQTLAEARAALASIDARVEARDQFSDTVPKGTVITTDPAPGGRVRKDGTIVLFVSQGPELFGVPDVTGKGRDEALETITQARLEPVEDDAQYSEDVEKGLVISQDPQSGEVRAGTEVHVVVSRGREPIEVSSRVGQDGGDAKDYLEGLGLQVSSSEQFSTSVAAGLVISQDPESGTLYRGDEVTLVVSKGPEMVTVPNVFNKNEADARKAIEDAGLEVSVTYDNGTPILGLVYAQSVAGGQQAVKGSTVELKVF